MGDPVQRPDHYNQGGIECIDAMRAAFGDAAVETFCQLNAFKYNWRAHEKGDSEQDLKRRSRICACLLAMTRERIVSQIEQPRHASEYALGDAG